MDPYPRHGLRWQVTKERRIYLFALVHMPNSSYLIHPHSPHLVAPGLPPHTLQFAHIVLYNLRKAG